MSAKQAKHAPLKRHDYEETMCLDSGVEKGTLSPTTTSLGITLNEKTWIIIYKTSHQEHKSIIIVNKEKFKGIKVTKTMYVTPEEW